jgi:uncharacterized membrane protein YoaK (UPF0700 family)
MAKVQEETDSLGVAEVPEAESEHSLDHFSMGKTPMEREMISAYTTLKLLGGFFAGCAIGAAGISWFGDWAWFFPLVLVALTAALITWRFSHHGNSGDVVKAVK